jgi:hypothetical protein
MHGVLLSDASEKITVMSMLEFHRVGLSEARKSPEPLN